MKEYVSITAIFDEDGNLLPVAVNWQDGRKFNIDRITDICYSHSLKSGGAGVRYTCRIMNQERYLFFENNRWFIEKAGEKKK